MTTADATAAATPTPVKPWAGELRAYSTGPDPPAGSRRLHLNEYRHKPPARVAQAAADAALAIAARLAEYPAGPDPALAAALARYVGAPSGKHILLAAGSDEVLRAVLDAAALRGLVGGFQAPGLTKLLVGVPTYTHFEHQARLRGYEVVAYPLEVGDELAAGQAGHPDDCNLRALSYYDGLMAAGCLVYLGNPNNPTGGLYTAAQVSGLATRYPRSFFVVDEAYIEYASAGAKVEADITAARTAVAQIDLRVSADCSRLADPGSPGPLEDPDSPSPSLDSLAGEADGNRGGDSDSDRRLLNSCSVVSSALAHRNVIIARTMSKAFGLAALRVGYAVGTAETISDIGVAVNPKTFNPMASPVALAALGELGHYLRTAIETCLWNRHTVATLQRAGWWARATEGNFYLVYVGDTTMHSCDPRWAQVVVGRLEAHGVTVRSRDDLPGLAGHVRVTSGTAEDSRAVLKAFAALQPPGRPPLRAYHACKSRISELKTLVGKTLDLLAVARVEAWAQSGTMLGVLRHSTPLIPGGIIPWDDDADLAYLIDGADPVAGLVPAFRACGLALQRNRTDAYWQVGTNEPGAVISPAHVDLFSYRAAPEPGPDGKPVYQLDDVRFREEDPASLQAHCNTKYAHDELYPLVERRFYDRPILMPAKSRAVLERALGRDFSISARVRPPGDENGPAFTYWLDRALEPA